MKKEKTQKIDGKSIAINTQHFTGVANFAKSDLQIPVNIWIDNNDTYEKGGDWKRVKIQLNTSSNTQHIFFASISLNTNKVIDRKNIINNKKCQITDSIMNEMEVFVFNNNFALSAIVDDIFTERNFFAVAIEGVKEVSQDEIKEHIKLTKEIIQEKLEDKKLSVEQQKKAIEYLRK